MKKQRIPCDPTFDMEMGSSDLWDAQYKLLLIFLMVADTDISNVLDKMNLQQTLETWVGEITLP